MNTKKIIYISVIIAFIISLSTACIKDKWEDPEPQIYPENFDTINYNIISIKDLQAMYKPGDTTILGDSIVIIGTVISSDNDGNIYKKMYVQDSTAGIVIPIDLYNISKDYPFGQKIAIKCGGLFITFDGNYSLGALYSEMLGTDTIWNIGRIQGLAAVKAHIFKLDGGKPIVPKVLKISQLLTATTSTLVKLENVQFYINSVGKTYADPEINLASVGHYIEDINNVPLQQILLYTSSYSTFAGDSVPYGNGSVVGIFGKYSGNKQLYINKVSDVKFNNPRKGTFYDESFPISIGTFTQYSVLGSIDTWFWQTFDTGTGGNIGCVTMAANGQEDWLISPALDFTGKSGIKLNFRHAINNITSWTDHNLYVSSDYDGVSNPNTNGTWTAITGWKTGVGSSWTFFTTTDLDVSAYDGKTNVHFAFKYTSPSTKHGTWEISRFSLKTD